MSKFWIEDPAILMKREEITNLWPSSMMDMNEKLNAITRLIVVVTLISYALTKKTKVVVSSVITLVAIVFLYYMKKKNMIEKIRSVARNEGFENASNIIKENNNSVNCFTKPTPTNPLMNVMPHEIHDSPNRKPAAKSFNKVVENDINEATKEFIVGNFDGQNVRSQLFDDLGDSFTFDRSMRAWHPTANTKIPNDQDGFANFCYGNMVSCKDGHELACI